MPSPRTHWIVTHVVAPLAVAIAAGILLAWLTVVLPTGHSRPAHSDIAGQWSNYQTGMDARQLAFVFVPFQAGGYGCFQAGGLGFELLPDNFETFRSGTLRCAGTQQEEGRWEIAIHPEKINRLKLRVFTKGKSYSFTLHRPDVEFIDLAQVAREQPIATLDRLQEFPPL